MPNRGSGTVKISSIAITTLQIVRPPSNKEGNVTVIGLGPNIDFHLGILPDSLEMKRRQA
ncbi:hypothetical protein FKF78_05530 [Aeromonas hydrophila]|nr:hypothetical protein [Aeromonas hydrophila]MBX9565627.1 hypothetical protein [Aeromonas hydrophila]